MNRPRKTRHDDWKTTETVSWPGECQSASRLTTRTGGGLSHLKRASPRKSAHTPSRGNRLAMPRPITKRKCVADEKSKRKSGRDKSSRLRDKSIRAHGLLM